MTITYEQAQAEFERAHRVNLALQERTGKYGGEPARFSEADILHLHDLAPTITRFDNWDTLTGEYPEVPVECIDREPLGRGLAGYLEGLARARDGEVAEGPRARSEREAWTPHQMAMHGLVLAGHDIANKRRRRGRAWQVHGLLLDGEHATPVAIDVVTSTVERLDFERQHGVDPRTDEGRRIAQWQTLRDAIARRSIEMPRPLAAARRSAEVTGPGWPGEL